MFNFESKIHPKLVAADMLLITDLPYSEKAFAVAGPRLWNELLTDELRGCNSLDTFILSKRN